MSEFIRQTEDWVSVTGTPPFSATQPLYCATEIAAFDTIDLMFLTGVDRVIGQAVSVTFTMLTGMQTRSETGWMSVGSNLVISAETGTTFGRLSLTSGLMKYLRWRVTASGVTAVRFHIEGTARAVERGA